MTGKQIAANLRRSRRSWGTRRLHSQLRETYCVLGVKAAEKGVSNLTLEWFELDDNAKEYADFGVETLLDINDGAESKNALISELEQEYPDIQFGVERFVAYLLKMQKKGIPRKWKRDNG